MKGDSLTPIDAIDKTKKYTRGLLLLFPQSEPGYSSCLVLVPVQMQFNNKPPKNWLCAFTRLDSHATVHVMSVSTFPAMQKDKRR